MHPHTLIYQYIKTHRFEDVIRVFFQMVSRHSTLDIRLFPSLIKACAGLSALKMGRQTHCVGTTSGFASDPFVSSSLVQMYLRFGWLGDARSVFDEMPQPDIVAFGGLVSGFAQKGCVEDAKGVFERMKKMGLEPNQVTWNGLISGFSQSGEHMEAVSAFRGMHSQGFWIDSVSVSSVLPAVSELGILGFGIQIHGCAITRGLGKEKWVASALIGMYGKCMCAVEIRKVFDEMEERDAGALNAMIAGLSWNGFIDDGLEVFGQFKDQGMKLNVISWTSIIAGCSQNGRDLKALELFREMLMNGVKPNYMTIPSILPACGNIAALRLGKSAHCFSVKSWINNDVHVGSALVDMYAKCGRIHLSRRCFDMMPFRNSASWNAMIGGYAMHGNLKDAVVLFRLMQRSGQKPDHITFTGLLSACSHCGLVDEGWYYFNSMFIDHGIEARMEHYGCMVNLLGRCGRLEEAYKMIKEMPSEPDGSVWGALLSSCRVHKNVYLGEIAARKLFHIEPNNPGSYILLSNIYGSKAMWAEVDRVRDMMKSMGLQKNPGFSWIELKNKVHMLLAGDKSHPQMSQIMEKLSKLTIEMKQSGYLAHTDFVLHDVEEQEKEQNLCGHSEKLAVVLGLLNTTPGSPLQVIKNLRICGDCHVVIKFISRFEHREIFVRDPNRFHHFKDGVCSCGDYW